MNEKMILVPSEDIVVRKIEDEIIIVPITSGIGNIDDKLYSFNETGAEIWEKFDGTKSVEDIANMIRKEYNEEDRAEIVGDIQGFIEELYERKILVEKI